MKIQRALAVCLFVCLLFPITVKADDGQIEDPGVTSQGQIEDPGITGQIEDPGIVPSLPDLLGVILESII